MNSGLRFAMALAALAVVASIVTAVRWVGGPADQFPDETDRSESDGDPSGVGAPRGGDAEAVARGGTEPPTARSRAGTPPKARAAPPAREPRGGAVPPDPGVVGPGAGGRGPNGPGVPPRGGEPEGGPRVGSLGARPADRPVVLAHDGSVESLGEFSRLLGGAAHHAVPGTEVRFGAHVARPGSGLMGEAGVTPFEIALRLDSPVDRALEFSVEVFPDDAGATRGRSVRIQAGSTFAGVQYAPRRAGLAQVRLTLLEARSDARPAGGPTGSVAVVDVLGASIAGEADPRVAVLPMRAADRGVGLMTFDRGGASGVAGRALGSLRVGRTAFRDAATRATEITVTADDPSGILAGLPQILTVAAGGSESAPFEIVLTDRTGEATLRMRAGPNEGTFAIRSVLPQPKPRPSLVVPLGARARCVVDWGRPSIVHRPGTAVVADPGIAAATVVRSPDGGFAQVEAEIAATSVGSTSVTIASEPFPAATTGIECVPEEARLVGGRFTLTGRSAGQSGEVRLSVASGRIEASKLPAGVTVVSDDKGRTAVLTVGPDAPAGDLTFDLAVTGAASVEVRDGTRGSRRSDYSIEAR